MKFLKFSRKQTERGYEILKFLAARRFGLPTATTEFLNLTPAPPRNGFRILKFTPELSDGFRNLKFTSVLRNRFEILKFTRASARLADTAQNFILQNRFKILKFIQEQPFAPRRVLPRVDSAEAGREEKFSKFDFANALLNFISLPPRKFKLALLKFASEVPRNRSEILNFMFASYKLKLALRKFTPEPRKFKPASAVRLNFALNSIPPARASKFENGVKFKGAAKFERSAR
nr:hypothetical protein [uncultured Campylobacter sp.]